MSDVVNKIQNIMLHSQSHVQSPLQQTTLKHVCRLVHHEVHRLCSRKESDLVRLLHSKPSHGTLFFSQEGSMYALLRAALLKFQHW